MKHFCSFSEAMREGIKMRPNQGLRRIVLEAKMHVHFAYIKNETEPPCGCSAPAGVFDWQTRSAEIRPTIENLIVYLNNEHYWTREQIADWLENEEEKLGFVHVVESESSSLHTEVHSAAI